MKNFKRFLTFVYALACAFININAAQGFQFSHFADDIPLSSKLVNVIFQDDDGSIYIGTASGLDRYDGYSIRAFTHDTADTTTIHDSFIEDIRRAPDGHLWVRAGNIFCVFDPSTDRFDRNTGAILRRYGIDAWPSLVAFGDDGDLWVWAEGMGIYRCADAKSLQINDPDQLYTNTKPSDIAPGGDSRMAVIDRTGYLSLIDTHNSRICAEVRLPNTTPQSDNTFTLYTDREGLIWIFSECGLWVFNPADGRWIDSFGGVPLPQGNVKDVLQDHLGRIWLAFDHNGVSVVEKDGHTTHMRNDPSDSRSLFSNTVTAIMEDRTGSIWLGSRKNGVSVYNDAAYKFDFTPFADINCICPESGTDIVYLGTDGSGIIVWNRATDSRRYIDTSRPGRDHDAIVCMALDAAGMLWAGTYEGGLMRISRDGHITRYTTDDGLPINHIWSIQPMPGGDLLLATLGAGVLRFNPATGHSEIFNMNNTQLLSDYCTHISEAPNNTYYISTSMGLGKYDPARGEITTIRGDNHGGREFCSQSINQAIRDSRGLLWVATREGLNVLDSKADSLYTIPLGGMPDFVLGIAEDASHMMWASNGSELVSIAVSAAPDGSWNFDTHRYDSSDGLQTSDFNQRSLCMLPDGTMAVGGYYGLNTFRPGNIRFGSHRPHVRFTSLSLFSQPVKVGEKVRGHVVLPRRIDLLDGIELDHDDNEFSIAFATDNYINPGKTRYLYRLDGFNEEWREVMDGQHSVSYTNLEPGRYKLRVRAITADGVESANVATLGIRVRPPFYASTVAKIIYLVLILALIALVFLVFRRHERRRDAERARAEAERRREELDQLKFRFFANVSHELRTPLTLITAPLDSLLKEPLGDASREKLEIIHSNADRLQQMVDQLLDFRKNEVAGLTYNPSGGDIVRFVQGVCDSFRPLAAKKHIHLTFFSALERLMMQFDEDKLGKTIMNLLSNAFKFTPEDGRIDVSLRRDDDRIEIAVADTGCGISDADKQRIFERFYQADGGRSANGGTGIGLSLVAEFVRLHGGTVAVADNGSRGTVFTVAIPIVSAESIEPVPEPAPPTAVSAEPATPRVLVVDDNPDLLRFINAELSGEYTIATARNGQEAIAEIARTKPDIVLSDIMMPGMDGIELCRRLKSDEATASIPVLILTAKHEVSAKIEGLTIGADDYMTKPFNIDVLRLRINKLLELRRHGVRRPLIEPEPERVAITSLDERLVEQAVAYVEQNMQRTELSVEELATELGMSRVHLYKRLKQITGKTPIEFIRVIRLKRAAQLLRESQLNISEIAYRCGFNNPKYFSRYFKEEFGVLPSVYQDKT